MSRKIITDDAVEMAFKYLHSSSEEIAVARANRIRAEYQAKRVFARLFRHADGNIEMRKAYATDHDDYAAAMERVAKSDETWELMSDQRNRAELILEAWRTAEASERVIGKMR